MKNANSQPSRPALPAPMRGGTRAEDGAAHGLGSRVGGANVTIERGELGRSGEINQCLPDFVRRGHHAVKDPVDGQLPGADRRADGAFGSAQALEGGDGFGGGHSGEEIIPYGIVRQSLSAFDPPNGIADDSGMDIVRNNIRHLMQREGLNEHELGTRSGAGQSWLNRYLAGKINKPNAEKVAQIAAYFGGGLTGGDLMYKDLTQPGAVASQPVGQEAVILQAAVKIEAYLQDMSLTPLPRETYSQRLFVAAQVALDVGADAILSGDKLVEGARSLAAKLRAIGGA